ncbi:MAG: dethiobiotin synthase [bacterium]|nr:dethiobiotin synthase [bacterium]
MTKSVFVTGVSTGVGKTYFSYLFLKKLGQMGMKTLYFKPVETGGDQPEDYTICSGVASYSHQPIYHFKNPLSPHLAAKMERRKINIHKIKEAVRKMRERKDIDLIVIEGAGGILVPLTEKYLYRDLISDLKIPIVVIASSYLGVINHSLLTIEAARKKGIQIKGFILNFIREPENIAEQTNSQALRRLLGKLYLGEIDSGEEILSDKITKKLIKRIFQNR